MPISYQEKLNNDYIQKIRELLKILPSFCSDYFRHIANINLSVRTRYAYAIEVRQFLVYLINNVPKFQNLTLSLFSLDDLKCICAEHIELYLEYSTLYDMDGRTVTNNERTRARKIAALRSFFKYYFKAELLEKNVAALIDTPKIKEKAIVRMDVNEVADFLDKVEIGSDLTAHQKKYHDVTHIRDMAIITLFLGTGIRISELVGIDMSDVNLENRSFKVTRKGGNQDILSFGNEVYQSLIAYYKQRETILPLPGHENALFLSIQRKRITVKAVENLVKKYASSAVPLKKITPHKLRSTFGTMLYRESGDIYLVADVLGHKDVNTTRKHYAAQSELNKQNAAKMIHLREEE